MQKEQISKDATDKFFDHEEQNIFNIITAKNKYTIRPFLQSDLEPDLVIKVKVPTKEYVQRGEHLSITNFVTTPSDKLQRAYKKAQKIIIKEMEKDEKHKESCNPNVAFQKSFKQREQVITKEAKLINQYCEEQSLEIECVNQFDKVLDVFNLQYHTFVYMLQAVCGFSVRAFMLYDEKIQDRHIYLFLNIGLDNLLKVATKYRIKKEIDYTYIDFFLNDPQGSDERPIKKNSQLKGDIKFNSQLKQINRYFGVHQGTNENIDIIEQQDILHNDEQKFLAYTEQSQQLFNFLKYNRDDRITNAEKKYIFACNRRKINPGCEKYYSRLKKRREFFELNKDILAKHGFTSYNEPVVCQEFILPSKGSKAATFFQKLEAILLYRAHQISPDGQLSLFLPMERIKLSYIVLKSTFRIDFLEKMGFNVLALSNNFQKFGNSNGKVKGGINGQALTNKWSRYSFFTQTKAVRDYFGDQVGYQVMELNYRIGYLSAIVIPYVLLFILEQIWGANVWQYTSQIEAVIFAISYSIYESYLKSAERAYSDNFEDKVSSKVFLNKYRGPYIRNVLTDEINEFRPVQSYWHHFVNTICLLIILAMLVAIGGIFDGCRFILRSIYDPLIQYSANFLSLPHLIAYSIFFFIVKVVINLVAMPLINLMIYMQNPPSDEVEKDWKDTLLFFYLIGIELIAFFFFFILEPFQNNSCYTDNCQDEMVYYVYSRCVISFVIAILQLIYIIFVQYIKARLQNLFQKSNEGQNYQSKLGNLLTTAEKEAANDEHKADKMPSVVNFHNFSICVVMFPLSPAISLITAFIQYISTRLALIYNLRRSINRSESIIKFTKEASLIFYIAIIINSWENVFALQFVETYMQSVIENLCNPLTEQNMFLLKLVLFAIYMAILLVIGLVSGQAAYIFSNNKLLARKNTKFNQYLTTKGGLKYQNSKPYQIIPLKTIFRVHNPDKLYYQINNELLYGKQEDPRGSKTCFIQAQN